MPGRRRTVFRGAVVALLALLHGRKRELGRCIDWPAASRTLQVKRGVPLLLGGALCSYTSPDNQGAPKNPRHPGSVNPPYLGVSGSIQQRATAWAIPQRQLPPFSRARPIRRPIDFATVQLGQDPGLARGVTATALLINPRIAPRTRQSRARGVSRSSNIHLTLGEKIGRALAVSRARGASICRYFQAPGGLRLVERRQATRVA